MTLAYCPILKKLVHGDGEKNQISEKSPNPLKVALWKIIT